MSALPKYADTGPRLATHRSPALVSARDLVRRYGEGDAPWMRKSDLTTTR
jgi:hypothetical protein